LTIDATPLGDVKWNNFSLSYNGEKPVSNTPAWMNSSYDIWFRDPLTLVQNLLSNPDFNNEFDYVPFQEHDLDGNHRFQDFMSGNWAWKQAVRLAFICYHVSYLHILGFDCQRFERPWFNVRPHNPRQRQDHSVCWHW
jgi:Plavaka transposase